MKVTTLAPWFGSSRQNAKQIADVIGKQSIVAIPFCGGCSEVPYIDARQILINDVHSHIVNLACVVSGGECFEKMRKHVERHLLHPLVLETAREHLAKIESEEEKPHIPNWKWATAYFINVWMARSNAGTESETKQPLASRFTASGGSSVKRYRSAVDGLTEWHDILKTKCEFTCLDFRQFLSKCKDRVGHAIYGDPPWIGAGDEYKHKFSMDDHAELAATLREFENCRVVVRHSDHEFYREAYAGWNTYELPSRTQSNEVKKELLFVNEPSWMG